MKGMNERFRRIASGKNIDLGFDSQVRIIFGLGFRQGFDRSESSIECFHSLASMDRRRK